VAIIGQQPTFALGGDFQQVVDLNTLLKDVADSYIGTVYSPAAMRHVTDQAMRIAMAERSVTCIIVPVDIQEQSAVTALPRKHGSTFSGVGYRRPEVVPKERDLEEAARVLNEGERVAMLVGAGALHATDEVLEAADILGAGIAKALLGKAAVPDDLPFVTGAIGLLGTKPSWDMMMHCDTLLMIGSGFPYAEFLPKEGQARGVQIDIEGRMLNLRYPMEVPLQGDSRLTLRRLIPMLRRKRNRFWREQIEAGVAEWWRVMETRADLPANPINPQKVYRELSKRLPDRCIITADSGSSANWFARDLKVRRGMMCSLSGNLATMCPGMPYAMAAKFAYPERVVIACVGDGAMQMLGNNCLITIANHWQEWTDPRLIVCVLNNQDLNQVTWEQRVLAGDPKFEASQDIPAFNYAAYAELLGLRGIRVERPGAIGAAWEEAFAADRPVVYDFVSDPDVPPLPPHIKLEQARNYASSILKGDPDRIGMIRQSFKQLVEPALAR
jgi:pyruvate dehydrogenase (quinone)